jgi:hypothetical protein
MAEIAGLKLIVPSSVAGSGVSVSASGKVTFTAASSISVNGCFNSSYDNYLIVIRGKISAITQLEFRMRASGSDATGSNYTRQLLSADSTTVSGLRQSSESWGRVTAFGTDDNNGVHFYLYGPYLAQPTATRGVSCRGDGPIIYDWAATHSLSTSYDGITFDADGAGTLSGALCVYGLAQ